MPFERLEPGSSEWTAYIANHEHRFQFAADRLAGLAPSSRVLDAATGVGYGAAFLADRGYDVVAVDRDAHALAIARSRYARPHVEYVEDDCQTLARVCGGDASFAAIVSFETLEHLPDPASFLRGAAGLLAHGGILIASTPNHAVSMHERDDWRHHEREYTASEFVALLGAAGFRDVQLFGQRLSALGAMRRDLRAEINLLRFNPATRFGFWLQTAFRGLQLGPALPERIEDFEIVPLPSPAACDHDAAGPFVLIATATK
jgi:2-polyprenyl-3-methyl-5-hydroxy-6-metoxy-1,4-benzoquinol methylase